MTGFTPAQIPNPKSYPRRWAIPNQQSKPRNRQDPYAKQSRTPNWLWRLAFLFMVIISCAVAAVLLYGRYQQTQTAGGAALPAAANPALSPMQRLYLENYLSRHATELQQPAGTILTPATFTVAPGETADTIAANLAATQLLTNPELFINYVHYYGLDSQLEAGEFSLDAQLTIPQLAATLTRAYAQDIELRFLEGWRLEEMARYLDVTTPAQITAADFLSIVQRRDPFFDLSAYDFLGSLTDSVAADGQPLTLEGFLFPDTYRVPQDADAAYLVDAMLRNFGQRVDPAMRQQFGVAGLTLHEAVILASIVEREAVLTEERPLIASVFYNRLAQSMKLDADPTVQYALGYQAASDTWWKSPLTLDDLQIDSPYNTYLGSGLPPGPIANPGLSSLQAVANPVSSSYLFFVVDCTATTPGTHIFSPTYEEHLGYVQRCR